MPVFLDTSSEPTLGIGVCGRCSRKFPQGLLAPDTNFPGLMVCVDDRDAYDPYSMPPAQPDNILLPFVRPDTPMTFDDE